MALLLGVPLVDLSMMVVLVPSARFAGWQWVLLALAFRPSGSVYLDVAGGVTIFLLGGRLFEARAKRQAGGPDAVASILRAAAELRGRSVTSPSSVDEFD
ncbi:MAG: hypothetical protein ACRDSZ_19140 [Pseudonocardiaceae bacterium]